MLFFSSRKRAAFAVLICLVIQLQVSVWVAGHGSECFRIYSPDLKLPAVLLKALEYLYVIPPPKALPLSCLIGSANGKNYKLILKTTRDAVLESVTDLILEGK